MNKIYLTWQEYEDICNKLCKSLSDKKFDYMIVIARGAFVAGAIMSHSLGMRDVYSLMIKVTETDEVNSKKMEPQLGENIDFSFIKDKSVLLVDDIFGSGITLSYANTYLKSFKPSSITTVVTVMNEGNYKGQYERANYTGEIVNGWVIFPWEEE